MASREYRYWVFRRTCPGSEISLFKLSVAGKRRSVSRQLCLRKPSLEVRKTPFLLKLVTGELAGP